MNVKEHILAAIRECLAKNLPASGKAILFGSQARGTAREDSDWDILIILDKKKLMATDYDNITYPLTELGWELGEEINPVMYTAQEWEKYRNTPFVSNITYPLTELGWELGEEINPVMYTAQEWEKYRNTPFVRNVEKEGVRIA